MRMQDVMDEKAAIARRFRGFLPVVVDVETAGFNARTDALLEVAAVLLDFNESGELAPIETVSCHVEPFPGANLERSALEFNGIDPDNPLRGALKEVDALGQIFKPIRQHIKDTGCTRAILVGHNATFDHGFLFAASNRAHIKRNPFHPFSCFDTVSLAGLAYGQTVLAKACKSADIPFNGREAHSALYDAERTAELFCKIVNQWQKLGGWPLMGSDDEDDDLEAM